MRKLARPAFLLLASGAFATGCAHLEVESYIYDRSYLDTEQTEIDALGHAAGRIAEALTDGSYDRTQAELLDVVERGYRDAIASREFEVEAGTVDRLLNDRTSQLRERLTRARASHESFVRNWTLAQAGAADATGTVPTVAECRAELARGDAELLDVRSWIDLQGLQLANQAGVEAGSLDGVLRAREIARTAEVAEEIAERQVFGDHIANDPQAWRVITSPKDAWRSMYDQAAGCGMFGNTDIALKRESADSLQFTVKGLRVDGAGTAAAVGKTTKHLVALAAASVGVPSGMLTSAQRETLGVTGAPEAYADLDETAEDAAQKRRMSRMAVLSVLDAIAAQQPVLDAANPDAAQVAAAVAAVRNAFAVSEAAMRTGEPGGSTSP